MDTLPQAALQLLLQTWSSVAARYQAYELVQPGSPGFICQPTICTARCCHIFSVAVSESDVARMEKASGFVPMMFLESEDGRPITLPLAHPYLLSREDNHCSLLGADLGCTQYEGRPSACRLYPHFVVFIDPSTGKPVHDPPLSACDAIVAMAEGAPLLQPALVPLLLRHLECPGFTGPPIAARAWSVQLQETFIGQYPQLVTAPVASAQPGGG